MEARGHKVLFYPKFHRIEYIKRTVEQKIAQSGREEDLRERHGYICMKRRQPIHQERPVLLYTYVSTICPSQSISPLCRVRSGMRRDRSIHPLVPRRRVGRPSSLRCSYVNVKSAGRELALRPSVAMLRGLWAGRVLALNGESLKTYFDDLENFIRQNEILPDYIWDFGGKAFVMGRGGERNRLLYQIHLKKTAP